LEAIDIVAIIDSPVTNRNDIKPGCRVTVIQKKHQPTGELTEGTVQKILTTSQYHPRGIKVMLEEDNIVGRVWEKLY
jgi:uncharacterized repeat protein (TIGR03833 family)